MGFVFAKNGDIRKHMKRNPIQERKVSQLRNKDGQWLPLQKAPKLVVEYLGYGSPLSKEQLKKLIQKMGK
jgi:hypothetical protein